ncbi:hypothetical protein D4764_20G0002380 [Takifugu flavidus]|uniref:Uncharacterized protein n=1 Tax=Takifugu flavidus TaxID=433684 RepID=A0A5C6NGI3_9TELE|nr:hypothetical protein D4764_20G0002380 [Takifugu flavidus]
MFRFAKYANFQLRSRFPRMFTCPTGFIKYASNLTCVDTVQAGNPIMHFTVAMNNDPTPLEDPVSTRLPSALQMLQQKVLTLKTYLKIFDPPFLNPLNILLTRVDIVANYQYLEVHVESKPDYKGGLLRNLSCRCSSSCWSLVALLRQQTGETHQKISTLE